MKITPITPENLSDCIAVFIKAYNHAPWNFQWTTDTAQQYLVEYMSSSTFLGFILYDEQSPVGAVLAHTKTWWTNKQMMIDEFFITSERQRKGYGKKLMDFCNILAREQHAELLVLMTNKYMPAYAFYEKLSYTTIEPYVFMFKQL